MKDRIIEMLGNGIPPSAVANAVGCDPSYVSQLMSDDGVRAIVAEAKLKDIESSIKVDNMIEDIERLALERMRSLIPFCSRPLEAIRMFEAVNGAKKRTPETTGVLTPTAPIVQINISAAAAVAFKLSSDQQIVEIDGRSTATLPTKSLNTLLKERQDARPLITDATTANSLLQKIEQGIPELSIMHVL